MINSIPKDSVPYYHNEECGEVALWFERMPEIGSVVSLKGVFFIDGTPVKPASGFFCGHCGKQMYLNYKNFTKAPA